MCTIALAWQALADTPVAIAANRDEALDRESYPPRVLEEDPQVVAPQDAHAGGTWIGVSERGLVVAVTNRWTEPPDPESEGDADGGNSDVGDVAAPPHRDERRSRGQLVRDALRADDADGALEVVREAVGRDDYAGFNLLVVDADRAAYLEWDGAIVSGHERGSEATALRERDLEPGVHAIVNPGLNDVDERAARLRSELSIDGTPPGAPAWLDAAAERLRDHEFDVCVHEDGFGTRSASLLAVDDAARVSYAFADGPPCETAFEQVSVPATFLEGSF